MDNYGKFLQYKQRYWKSRERKWTKKGIRHPWIFPSNGIVTYLPNQAFIPEDKVDLYGFGKNTENINVSFN